MWQNQTRPEKEGKEGECSIMYHDDFRLAGQNETIQGMQGQYPHFP